MCCNFQQVVEFCQSLAYQSSVIWNLQNKSFRHFASHPPSFRYNTTRAFVSSPTVRLRSAVTRNWPFRQSSALFSSTDRRTRAMSGLPSLSASATNGTHIDTGDEMKEVENDPVMKKNLQWVPHRADPKVPVVGPGNDWVTPTLEALKLARDFRPPFATMKHAPRVLVLYGSLRPTAFSKSLAYECARICEGCGLDVRVFNPEQLPVRDPSLENEPKVVELRSLVEWSEAHIWVGSELHGNLSSVFKNQIDWIPLNTGSVRPTQGKTCVVLQVCGGSQSFNVVNTLRLLARWMRMSCVVNQSSVPMAWKQFDDDGRMKEGSLRERVVDVMEEFVKSVRINREFANFLTDRFSERKEKEEKGRLLTQAEKEAAKDK